MRLMPLNSLIQPFIKEASGSPVSCIFKMQPGSLRAVDIATICNYSFLFLIPYLDRSLKYIEEDFFSGNSKSPSSNWSVSSASQMQ